MLFLEKKIATHYTFVGSTTDYTTSQWWQVPSFMYIGGSATERDTRRLDKRIRKAGSVLGRCLDSLRVVVERRMWTKLSDIMDNIIHPLHHTVMEQSSSHSGRLTVLD